MISVGKALWLGAFFDSWYHIWHTCSGTPPVLRSLPNFSAFPLSRFEISSSSSASTFLSPSVFFFWTVSTKSLIPLCLLASSSALSLLLRDVWVSKQPAYCYKLYRTTDGKQPWGVSETHSVGNEAWNQRDANANFVGKHYVQEPVNSHSKKKEVKEDRCFSISLPLSSVFTCHVETLSRLEVDSRYSQSLLKVFDDRNYS